MIAPHNDEYHLMHHLYARVPHYRVRDAHNLMMQVPGYAGGGHCDGFFWPRRSDKPSVIQDITRRR